eukprot:3026603-Rhodomonas_salina.1
MKTSEEGDTTSFGSKNSLNDCSWTGTTGAMEEQRAEQREQAEECSSGGRVSTPRAGTTRAPEATALRRVR